jgi:transcriptional regulator with XRE-family HTH domain
MSFYTLSVPKPSKLVPPPLPETIPNAGVRLALLRKRIGLSQEALAEKTGITRKQVSDYERGMSLMNHEMIIRFALALGVSSDEILGLSLIDIPQEAPSLRYTRRIQELEKLPEQKIKAILKTLDDLIRANQ